MKLPWSERIAYGVGCVGLQLTYMFFTTYFMFYLTDIYGITGTAAGTIMLVARVWDAINDPICGVLADRTRTRIGAYRPWIFTFCVPVVIFGALAFSAPDLPAALKTLYIGAMYILWGMAHTCVNMPFGILANVMTQDYQERALLGSVREIGSNVGQLLSVNLGTLLLGIFCVTEIATSSDYMKTFAVIGLISVVCLVICAALCKERIPLSQEKVSFADSLRHLKGNKYALLLGVVTFMFILFLSFRMSWNVYYCNVYLQNPDLIAPFTSATTLPPIVILFFVPWLTRRLGKRNLMILGGLLIAVSGVVFLAAGQNIALNYTACILAGVGQSFPLAGVWAALPDAADWGEVKTGIRAPGIVFTYGTFMVKLSGAVTGYLAGVLIDMVGYDGLAASQTASAVSGIYWANGIMVLVAGLLTALTAIPYKLDREEFDRVSAQLSQKRSG